MFINGANSRRHLELTERDPVKLSCSRFKANVRNYSFRQSTAAIWTTHCHFLFWRFKSEQSQTRPGTIRLRVVVKTGGGNTASSRSLDAETCWGKIALFICTAGLIMMLAKPYTISTPPQSLFPHLSILQLFFPGTSSYSEDYFHMQLKTKIKWHFKLSRS